MSNNLKTFGMLAKFVDDTVGSLLSGWGTFTAIFVFLIPLIAVLALVKWLFLNGYIS